MGPREKAPPGLSVGRGPTSVTTAATGPSAGSGPSGHSLFVVYSMSS